MAFPVLLAPALPVPVTMDFPQRLKEQLRAGRVIPFVGAGVSMAVLNRETGERLFPSWRDLLLKAADRLEAEQKPKDATLARSLLDVEEPDYLYAASRARAGLGPVWYRLLKDALNPSHGEAGPDSLALAQAIWGLGSNLVITTNYDRVLDWACPRSGDLATWDIQATAEQAVALQVGVTRPTVWHLHGRIDNAASLILTPDGYRRLYPEAGDSEQRYNAALATLRSLLASHTFLFAGFSLDDAYFGMQLRGISEIFQGASGPHYVLAREADRERIRGLKLPVEVVTFADFGAPLLECVRTLGEIAREGKSDGAGLPSSQPGSAAGARPVTGAEYDPRNPPFNVPFAQKGSNVVGREEALERVRQQLTSGRRTSIGQTASFHGLGGLGKTQLAVEYAYRYRDEYPNGVIWITADQDIDAQLTDLAEKARWIAPESEPKYRLDIARQRLRAYSDCLIVFDNVESAEAIVPYLPEPQAQPHLLLTSRTEQPGFTPVDLDPLDPELSLRLLVQEARREPQGDAERGAAQEIVGMLGGLPLALEIAGAYLGYRTSVSWAEYRERLRRDLPNALSGKHLDSFTKHESDLHSTLKVGEDVYAEEPRLRDILDLLTWSGPAPMGISLMCAMLETERLDLANGLSLGVSLRILQKSPDSESYAIHRLVREVRRADVPISERVEWAEGLCRRLGDWFEERRDDFHALAQFEADIDHLHAWLAFAQANAPKQGPRLIWLQAYPFYHRGQYSAIQQLVTHAFQEMEHLESGEPTLEAHLWNDLGFALHATGKTRDGLRARERALSIRLELLGEQHADTARSYNNVGSAYSSLGNHRRALEYAEKALAIQNALFGEQHRDTAASCNNVGSAFISLGDHRRGLEYIEKALAIHIALFGEQHPNTAALYNNVGGAYSRLGNHRHGLEYAEKALAIRIALFGEQHPNTAASYNSAGSAFISLGDHRRGLEYTEKALAIQIALFGEQHPDTAASYNNVGSAFISLGDHRRGLEYIEKALAIRITLFSEQHPDTAASYNNVGQVYGRLGDQNCGLKYAEKALAIQIALFGEQHPDTATSFNNVGSVYGSLGNHRREFEYVEKALALRIALFSEQHPDTAASYNNVGQAYRSLGDYRRGLEYTEKALSIHRELLGEQHPDTVLLAQNYAVSLYRVGRKMDALNLADRLLRILPKDHTRYAEVKELHRSLASRTPGFRSRPEPGGGGKGKKRR